MKKKILILSTGDANGAYEAAYRITTFAKDAGFETAMLVKYKTRSDSFVIPVSIYPAPSIKRRLMSLNKRILRRLNLLPAAYTRPATNPDYLFLDEDETINYISGAELLSYCPFNPDIIIAGMTNGFVNTNTLAEMKALTNANIYCWMTDMSPITGGCHYAWNCKGYELECKNCPAIINKEEKDWPNKNLMIKEKNIAIAGIQVIAMSEWTVQQARRSHLFRNQKEIFNTNSCIDTTLFNSKNRSFAKQIFSIPTAAKLIFAGSQNIKDKRKGVVFFIEALNILSSRMDHETKENTIVLIAGRDNQEVVKFADQIPFKKHFIEYIKDYRLLSLAYQAADVFVCASIEDSGPMMVSEALACGTPVVGFNMGVVSNMVETGVNGYKAELKNSLDLAIGIESILKLNQEEFNLYSTNAVIQVEKYSSQNTVIDIINHL